MKQDRIRLLQYASIFLVLYIVVILICGMFISIFNFASVSEEAAPSLVSLIIQSQVTIISIVITLSLVAIQITASQYSSTIVDYIQRHPVFWILVTIYTILTIYGLTILKILSGDSYQQFLGIPLSDYVSLEFGIAVYSLIILVPYLYFTIELLSAKKIIDDFSKDIDKKSILNKDENFNFLFTIIRSSLLKNDLEVATYGLDRLSKIIINVLKNSSKDEIEQINIIYVGKLRELQSLSLSMNFEFITGGICNFHYFTANEVLENNLPLNLELQISALSEIAQQAIKQNSNLIFNTSIHFLNKIALETSQKNRQKEYEQALDSIQFLGQLSINYRNQVIFTLCVDQLKSLALYQITLGSDHEVGRVVFKMGVLLDDAGLQNYSSSLSIFTTAFKEIETEIFAKDMDFEESINILNRHERKLGDLVISSSQMMIFISTIENLKRLFFYSIESKNDKLTTNIISNFHGLLVNGVKSENKDVYIQLMIQLHKEIANCYIKHNETKNFIFFIESCRTIAFYLIENHRNGILFDFLNNLGELEKYLISHDFDEESSQLLNLFYLIGKTGIEKGIFDFTFIAPLEILKDMDYDVFTEDPSQNKSPIFLVIQLLQKSGVSASNKKLVKSTKSTLIYLGRLYATCVKDGYFAGAEKIASGLIDVGSTSFINGVKEAIQVALNQIEHIIKFAEKKEKKITLQDLVSIDIGFGCNAIEGKMPEIAKLCALQILTTIPDLDTSQINMQFKKIFSQLTDVKERAVFTEFKELYQKILSEKQVQST
ncbi:MAG: DUF2254 family protein [Methanoregula sp.]